MFPQKSWKRCLQMIYLLPVLLRKTLAALLARSPLYYTTYIGIISALTGGQTAESSLTVQQAILFCAVSCQF